MIPTRHSTFFTQEELQPIKAENVGDPNNEVMPILSGVNHSELEGLKGFSEIHRALLREQDPIGGSTIIGG